MKKTKKGTALAYALVMIAVVSILLTSVMRLVVTRLQMGYYEQSKQEAFEIAEAGVFWYRWYLAHQTDGKSPQDIKTFWQTGSPLGVASPLKVEYKDPTTGDSIGWYEVNVTAPDASSTVANIEVTGWTNEYPDYKKILKVRLRRQSWSEYSVLGDDYQRFGSGTTVNGKLFVNGGIHFDGVATNTVSSSVPSYYDSDSDVLATKPGVWTSWPGEYNTSMGSNVFLAGKQINAPAITFSSAATNFTFMRSEAQAGRGKYFGTDGVGQWIKLKTDGTFDSCTVNSYDAYSSGHTSGTNEITDYIGVTSGATGSYSGNNGTPCTMSSCCAAVGCGGWISSSKHAKGKCGENLKNYPIVQDGNIFTEGDVWLEGAINTKRTTVAAVDFSGGGNVFITKNVTYTNFDNRDILGIVAEKNIEITKNSNSTLTIDGAILAVNGRVGREPYSMCRNTISVFGAIATNLRYGFAYTGSSCGCSVSDGYCTRNLTYDNNLLYYPPPYFPTGSQYLIDLWDEQ